MTEKPKNCPKCGNYMDKQQGAYALPGYIDQDKRGPEQVAISTKSPLPIDVHFCPNCRYVELWA